MPNLSPHAVGVRFSLEASSEGVSAAWIRVTGELDLATTPQLTQALRVAGQQALLVVLDLRAVTFLDSAGVHAIVDASVAARDAGRRLLLLRAPDSVHRIFKLTGTTDEVEVLALDADASPAQVLLQLSRASAAA